MSFSSGETSDGFKTYFVCYFGYDLKERQNLHLKFIILKKPPTGKAVSTDVKLEVNLCTKAHAQWKHKTPGD